MRFSEAEWKVMRVVWRRPGVAVREIVAQLDDETGWSYSTVKTMLARLVEKGALRLEKDANLYRYTATVDERDAQRSAVRSLLDRAFDGTLGSLLHHLVAEEKLSRREVDELRALLAEEQAPQPAPGAPAAKRKERG
jgi:BlaI family transcriptional regulator, penicillinase repressor